MRKLVRAALIGAVVGTTLTSLAAPALAVNPERDQAGAAARRPDNRPGPLTHRQEAMRKEAQRLILSGQASADEDGVVQLAGDKYYQAAVTGTGRLFTILGEFGDAGSGKLGTVPGPRHNQIAEPNRNPANGPVDNSTIWRSDFNRAYYMDVMFGSGESMANFYAAQSSGNYTVAGTVTDWVQVPGNASTYGDNTVEDNGGTWQFLKDAANAWVASQSPADAQALLATFDVWDRYDFDSDGNFDEPDGYIDHFQAVHAGEGEEAGGGAQGGDAIWSHRWYAYLGDYGLTGPTVGDTPNLQGGFQIGNTGYWIGDYTVEPENGGLGIFAHEFGHDLGLPDFYDTNAGENGTAFWTLMSSGSWLSHGVDDIGSTPNHFGPWEKLQLGWLSYAVVSEGQGGSYTLSPAALQTTGQPQAIVVDVPDRPIDTNYATPTSGTRAWWTTSADDLNTTLTRSLDLSGVRSATVNAKVWYDIEAGYDFLYGEYSTDNGANWLSAGAPIDGSSNGRWVALRWSLPGGAPVLFRFRFQSDSGVHLTNAFIDDIVVKSGGTTIFSDNVENGANGWTAVGGFRESTGTERALGDRYYLVENRTYVGYDATLQTGPYQFSFAYTAPNRVERFAFEDGMLVWMVDETYGDNNTSQHGGRGQALPVDARPAPFKYSDGTMPSNRRQPFDATFGLQATAALTLHKEVKSGKTIKTLSATAPSVPGIATFNDTNEDAYWDSSNPQNSTKVAGHGVTVTVTSQATNGAMTVTVNNPQ